MNGVAPDLKLIFGLAVEIESPTERAAYLDEACGRDSPLRSEVERLLLAAEQAGSFMDGPAVARDDTQLTLSVSERAGTLIGPYKLLQQIGEGGMGVVFMAEQTEPIQRTVALKIIKPGMDTRQVIARFEAERQAVAMMDHPNIARVVDAGTTETGRPYFVMDLVKGAPITRYCDEKNLSLRERLELFLPVCQAVQHAHQKGIIHRDIKPNNVLVAEYDNHAVPKVIDFGVAKATAQKLTERTMFTEFGQIIGTVEYMSPEQAKFNQLDIDTRSDIYSLGVLLYELLAGSTPFEATRMREAAFDEVLRIIREEEPPKLSTRLSHSDALPSIAARRHIEPNQLTSAVRGDLDWIVMRTLEKDRGRRYPSADALADDLKCFLNDQPISACPPSSIYRLKKFVRRNRLAVMATAAVGIALIAGTTLATIGFIQARRQAARADAAAVRATSFNNYLQKMLQSVDPEKRGGQEVTVRQLLDEFSAGLSDQFASQPEVEADIQRAIGLAYRRLDANKCEMHLRRAMELRRQLVGDQHVEFADSLVDYGIAQREQWRASDSEASLRRALQIYDGQGTNGRQVIKLYEILEIVLILQHRSSEVEAVFNQAKAVANQTPNEQIPEMANMYHGLIVAKIDQSKFDEAETLARQSLDMHLKLQGPNHPETGWGYCDLGRALAAGHKFAEALDALQRAMPVFQRALPPGAFDTRGQLDRLTAVIRLASKSDQLVMTFSTPQQLEKLAATYRTSLPNKDNTLGIDPRRTSTGQFAPGRPTLVTALDRPVPGIATAVQTGLAELARVSAKLEAHNRASGNAELADKFRASTAALQSEARSLSARVATEEDHAFEQAKLDAHQLLENPAADAPAWNDAAWVLIVSPNPVYRDPKLAIELETMAIQRHAIDEGSWELLAAAWVRAGEPQGAIEPLQKSLELTKGGDVTTWLLLAIANWQLGHKDEARTWFSKASELMDEEKAKGFYKMGSLVSPDRLYLLPEAANLLGISEKQNAESPTSKPKP